MLARILKTGSGEGYGTALLLEIVTSSVNCALSLPVCAHAILKRRKCAQK